MESPRKFNDCYFYYYSTCTKGDNCVFRHEPSALGCETMCTAWQQGKCLDKRCKLRHMELRKNRKQIPCYWENQPGGCRKKHCPFMHKNPDARTDGIAPSQPAPQQPAGVGVSALGGVGVGGVGAGGMGAGGMGAGGEGACEPALPPQPAPPLPMLWQHQQPRQVVLDSAILGVLPGSTELVGGVGRRVDAAPAYPLPVDPLVVNFEEESDTESAPSSTPTKPADDSKRHELLLLERIQAEAAALYSYDALPPPAPTARANLNKYDRLSLDEIAGKKHPPPAERRKSLDFKVLSLDEIRARKKTEAVIQKPPITLNLCRKRKLSTQETVTTSGNKIIKVIRSNSIVYKKVDPEAPATAAETTKTDQRHNEHADSRKRTMSEASEGYEIQENELVDNCYEFKRIKVVEHTFKPKLIRNRPVSLEKASTQASETEDANKQDDSDSEVQIISVDLAETTNIDLSDSEIIDVDSTKMGEPIDIVDLSDDDDVTESDLGIIVPDVVASCQKKLDNLDKDILKDIDSILNENNDSLDEDL